MVCHIRDAMQYGSELEVFGWACSIAHWAIAIRKLGLFDADYFTVAVCYETMPRVMHQLFENPWRSQ